MSASSEARPLSAKKPASRLVAPAPDDGEPDGRHKLSSAKGFLIGAGICAAFWGAVAAAVIVRR